LVPAEHDQVRPERPTEATSLDFLSRSVDGVIEAFDEVVDPLILCIEFVQRVVRQLMASIVR
jgi:hypothetical protein